MKLMKRLLCLLLVLVMVLGYIPGAVPAEASQEDGICEKHHPVHTEECGYVPAEQGSPCRHEEFCDGGCKQPVEKCVFPHENCDCQPEVQAQPCNGSCALAQNMIQVVCECPENEDGTVTHIPESCTYQRLLEFVKLTYNHDASCGYTEYQEAKTCNHACTVDSGCVIMQCSHGDQHDETCGYSEGTNGEPCEFAGRACEQCAAEEEKLCDENCMLQPGHEGDCVLYCETEFCAKAQGHKEPCAMACGCPVTVPEHLESCDQFVSFEQTMPMYAYIGNGDGNYVVHSSETVSAGGEGPWMTMCTQNGLEGDEAVATHALTGVVSSDPEICFVRVNEENEASIKLEGRKAGTVTLTATSGEVTYSFNVTVIAPQYRLMVCYEDNASTVDIQNLAVGHEMNVRCLLGPRNGGPPVTQESILNAYSDNPDVFTLTDSDENGVEDGIYVLKAVGPGSARIICEVNGKYYSASVTVLDNTMVADGLLYYPEVHTSSGATFPKTCMNMWVGQIVARDFYFSSAATFAADSTTSLTPLKISDGITWSGPIDVSQVEGDTKLYIEGTGQGTGYLELTDAESGITHCFAINVGMNTPRATQNEGSYLWLGNGTYAGFANLGIASSNNTSKQIAMLNQLGGAYTDETTDEYREPLAFAIYNEPLGEPVKARMDQVTKDGDGYVHFSILGCTNKTSDAAPNLIVEQEDSQLYSVTDTDISTLMNYVAARPRKGFKAVVGMTFDMPDTRTVMKDGQETTENITRRITLYLPTHYVYWGSEVNIHADDITSAKQLNVILSSYESLLNWIEKTRGEEMGEKARKACNINISLPAGGDYTDAVVVAQAIADYPYRADRDILPEDERYNPNFRIYLYGPTQGTKPKMAGLVSKGSLGGVYNIDFVASADEDGNA